MRILIIISSLIMISGCTTTITKDKIVTVKDCDTHNKVFINVEEENKNLTDLSSNITSYHYINSISNMKNTQTTHYISELTCEGDFLNIDNLPEGKCQVRTENIKEGLLFTVKDGQYQLQLTRIISMNKNENGLKKPIIREFVTSGVIPETSSSIKDSEKYETINGLSVIRSNLVFCRP